MHSGDDVERTAWISSKLCHSTLSNRPLSPVFYTALLTCSASFQKKPTPSGCSFIMRLSGMWRPGGRLTQFHRLAPHSPVVAMAATRNKVLSRKSFQIRAAPEESGAAKKKEAA